MLQYVFSEEKEASPLTSLPRPVCDFQVMNSPLFIYFFPLLVGSCVWLHYFSKN